MSYAARATRFLAERRGLVPLPTPGCDGREVPPGADPAVGYEINEINEESPPVADGVWRPDPTPALPPADADDWDRATHAAYAPVLRLPPRGCLGPRVCARLGVCARARSGGSCEAAR
jgi:hypothetical protein